MIVIGDVAASRHQHLPAKKDFLGYGDDGIGPDPGSGTDEQPGVGSGDQNSASLDNHAGVELDVTAPDDGELGLNERPSPQLPVSEQSPVNPASQQDSPLPQPEGEPHAGRRMGLREGLAEAEGKTLEWGERAHRG